jgi:hypothetical protein
MPSTSFCYEATISLDMLIVIATNSHLATVNDLLDIAVPFFDSFQGELNYMFT